MPYTSEIRVSTLNSTPLSGNVSIVLVQLFAPIGTTNRWQVDQETVSVSVSGGIPKTFSTVDGPDYPFNSIALAAFQSGLPGPVFRSGKLETLPAGAPGNADGLIDVMLLAPNRFTMAEINAMIPTPFTLADGTIVTSVTITSAPPSDILTLVATGPHGTGTFTYILSFTIDPSVDQFDLSSVMEAHVAQGAPRGTLVLSAGTGGGLEVFLESLFVGLFLGGWTGDVLRSMTSIIDNTAASAAMNAFAELGISTGLPKGIVLGVRSVSVSSNGSLLIRPAIGCFGSLFAKILSAIPPDWRDNDLSIRASEAADAPPQITAASGSPMGYVFANIQHVVFRGTDNHIHELWWEPGDPNDPNSIPHWHDNDLSVRASEAADAPPQITMANSSPMGYVFANIQHVVFQGTDGHIHELWWEPPGIWHDNDLSVRASEAADAPPQITAASGSPMGYVFANIQHVVFQGTDGHIHELRWSSDPTPQWHDKDLSEKTGAPSAFSDPMGYVFANLQHVVFRGADGHIHELSRGF